ncbi:MAG: 37S ribosomal protein S24, mitochondrial [Thelocarpon impressellum]|nr:MAG: 37S ribosomal protein S24, mitochondrial [Thelocarpon impressellum]
MKQPAVEARLNAVVANAAYAVESERPRPANPPEKWVPSFVGMYEEDEKEWPKDDDFMEDDMTSHGHGNLEQHREIREYARITAWEMPLLSKLSKPFAPPAADHPLRFRYTTYMGEQHPAEKKIVLEFCTRDLPDLNETQRSKLVKLVGVRYNPDSDIVKMSCEMFDTQAQNKRYLGDLVDTLVREAKDERDTFADVPFDFRHHKPKRQPRFPDQWLLTPERRKYLEESRQQRLQLDEERERKGALVDGLREIERAVVRMPDVSAVAQSIGSGKQKGGAKRLVKARQ